MERNRKIDTENYLAFYFIYLDIFYAILCPVWPRARECVMCMYEIYLYFEVKSKV